MTAREAMQPFNVETIALFGRNLVDASAGTGKTYAISTLFVRLLLETPYRIGQLLVVTFTEAATSELRSRIRDRLREALAIAGGRPGSAGDETLARVVKRAGAPAHTERRLREALESLDSAEISTIHGYCQRTLVQRAFQSDVTFGSELFGDPRPRIDEIVLDFWATHAGPSEPRFFFFMLKAGFNLSAAKQLAHAVMRSPDAHLVPGAPPAVEVASHDALIAEIASAREIWQRHDVASIIQNSSIRKNPYNRRHTPTWEAAVRAYFDDPGEPLAWPPDALSRFGTQTLREFDAEELCEHEAFVAVDGVLEAYQRVGRALDAELVGFKLTLVDYVKRELPRRTRASGQLSFDDLLSKLHSALHAAGGDQLADDLRQRHPVALIDEFQDTDPTQLEIFEKIYSAPSASLFLIGDPKQAIYSFRGADVFSYVRAALGTAPDRRYTMTTNYRSDPSMVAAVNAIFSARHRAFLLEGIEFHPVESRPGAEDALSSSDGPVPSGLELLVLEPEPEPRRGAAPASSPAQRVAHTTARDIASLLGRGLSCAGEPVNPADVAVLTRTNDQAFEVQAALRELSIPSVVLGDKSVYDSVEAEELERVLSAVVEPTSVRRIRTALSTDLLGLSANEIQGLDADDEAWEGWLTDFRELNGIWAQTGFVQTFRALMSRRGVRERLLSRTDSERRLTNLLHLSELLHSAALSEHLGPSSLLAYLIQRRRSKNWGMEADAAQIRLESDARAVKITTMHKSKGLEYAIVYCPYLWHGTLLHPSDELCPKLHDEAGRLILDVGSSDREEHLRRAAYEQFAENVRLLYVALTRARHRCVVTWGRLGRYATSALGYLLHARDLDEPLDLARLKARLGALDESAFRADLEALAARAPITVRSADPAGSPLDRRLSPDLGPLAARVPKRVIDSRYRNSSFSALTSHASLPALAEELLLKDRDERTAEAAFDETVEDALPLASFPRGAKAGSFFHEVLEHYDFGSARPGSLVKLVNSKLAAYQYSVADWSDAVCEGLLGVIDTELAADDRSSFRLTDVSEKQRLSELEFCLPVALDAARGQRDALDARALAEVFEQHPSDALPGRVAAVTRRLHFVPLKGFLRGFVDLIVRVDGRFFLMDYKANHLGHRATDYASEALSGAMLRGHYFLQYHLYALALDRYLRVRLPDYDYERHFGGVYYLFLRGMGPKLGRSGIFFEKPPKSRLEALSTLLETAR